MNKEQIIKIDNISLSNLEGKLCDLNKKPAAQLDTFFVEHLNRIYCVKCHLAERLPEIADHAHFGDLKNAIVETIETVDRQISRMDRIYELLHMKYIINISSGLVDMIEDAFTLINNLSDHRELRDLSILFYMQIIENIEIASFQMINIAFAKRKDEEIVQMILENYNEAKQARSLFQQINIRYITCKEK